MVSGPGSGNADIFRIRRCSHGEVKINLGRECRSADRLLRRACPLCGDPGWDYVNGMDDRDGMACRISCGYRWPADDPGWQAQVLPS